MAINVRKLFRAERRKKKNLDEVSAAPSQRLLEALSLLNIHTHNEQRHHLQMVLI